MYFKYFYCFNMFFAGNISIIFYYGLFINFMKLKMPFQIRNITFIVYILYFLERHGPMLVKN